MQYDVRLTPKIRTTIAVPAPFGERFGTDAPNPQKESAEGGTIVWRTLEHSYAEKTREWFWAIGIVAGALALAAVILGNILFGVLVVIATVAVFLAALRKPAHIRCELGKNGFVVQGTRYQYTDLFSFWVDDGRDPPVLHIKTNKTMTPYLNIPVRKEDAQKIRGFLGRRVSEEEFREPFAHLLAEAFGL